MSDSVTNVEIEDVLSSIRRLIADGDQRDPVPAQPVPEAGGPLMLTQSLRVGNEDAPPPVETPPSREAPANADSDPLAIARAVARIEGAVTAQNAEFEPDGSEVTALTGDTPVFRAHEREVAPEAPEATLPQPRDGDLSPAVSTPDDIADDDEYDDEPELESLLAEGSLPEEQVLRDLIAEILRDELAGGLGERITRNVRKLVRREIYRVLDSRELE